MKFSSLILVVASLIAVSAANAEDPGVIAPFALAGLKPNSKVVFSESQPKKLTALCFLGTECPLAKLYAGRLQKLADEFDSVRFIGINSNVQDSLSDIEHYTEATGIKFEMAKDARNVIADKLAINGLPKSLFATISERSSTEAASTINTCRVFLATQRPARISRRITQALAGKKIEVSRTEPQGVCWAASARVPPTPPSRSQIK